MEHDREDIYVNDPVWREEVYVTCRGRGLYFVKYDDDPHYEVLDEHAKQTTHTWRGDFEGIADFIALADLFDELYPAGATEGGDA
jgi:hypothetical protein